MISLLIYYIYCYIVSEKRKSPFRDDNNGKHILVKTGINTADLSYGVGRGDAFYGKIQQGTVLANGTVNQNVSLSLLNQGTGMEENLNFQQQLIIGRSAAGNDGIPRFCIESDPYISKSQCVLFRKEQQLFIRNLSSHNVTYLNGEKLTGDHVLNQGDVISIGYTKLRVGYNII